MSARFDAVLFDLLSALLDSWSLWDELAGDPETGRRWRMRYLEMTSGAGSYVPYLPLVASAAKAEGLDGSLADTLAERWHELEPWPEARQVVERLSGVTRIGVVTNCTESMGQTAAARLKCPFEFVLTAEQAGFYKPDRRIYQQAIDSLGLHPGRILYVAGSPFDAIGAANAGLPVYWHNRLGLEDAMVGCHAEVIYESLSHLPELIA